MYPLNKSRISSEHSNNVIFNRYIGWLGSLGDEISQLSLNYVQPWILGRERPVTPHMSVSRNQWPIIYMQNPNFLTALFNLEKNNFLEAQLYGLRSFLGPNKYLFKTADHIKASYTAVFRKPTETGRLEQFSEMSGSVTLQTGLYDILSLMG